MKKSILLFLSLIITILMFCSYKPIYADNNSQKWSISDMSISDQGISGTPASTETAKDGKDTIYKNLKLTATGLMGLAFLISLFLFIIRLMEMQAASANPARLAEVKSSLLRTGIITALSGAVLPIVIYAFGFLY